MGCYEAHHDIQSTTEPDGVRGGSMAELETILVERHTTHDRSATMPASALKALTHSAPRFEAFINSASIRVDSPRIFR
jgi:hypothetical protein